MPVRPIFYGPTRHPHSHCCSLRYYRFRSQSTLGVLTPEVMVLEVLALGVLELEVLELGVPGLEVLALEVLVLGVLELEVLESPFLPLSPSGSTLPCSLQPLSPPPLHLSLSLLFPNMTLGIATRLLAVYSISLLPAVALHTAYTESALLHSLMTTASASA
ncbi:unnamed protein product [Closterium sp. NIES-54]